jgi:hypothetical protein
MIARHTQRLSPALAAANRSLAIPESWREQA